MGIITFLSSANRKFRKIINKNIGEDTYDFNRSNPLGGNGERVDIQLNKPVNFNRLDIYQKNHWKRYEFAKTIIKENGTCGDFACGTGYGSILMAGKAGYVIGADINSTVINKIKERYKHQANVCFLNEDLLNLVYADHFDNIVSFETLEHFREEDIRKLMIIFSKALKNNGRLIFSMPYMQEQSEQAIKMNFHFTFYINEEKIKSWLQEAGLKSELFKYQNYDTHTLEDVLGKKEFIICIARKIND